MAEPSASSPPRAPSSPPEGRREGPLVVEVRADSSLGAELLRAVHPDQKPPPWYAKAWEQARPVAGPAALITLAGALWALINGALVASMNVSMSAVRNDGVVAITMSLDRNAK